METSTTHHATTPDDPAGDARTSAEADGSSRLHAGLEFIRKVRFRDGLYCPHCGSESVQRWGTFSGRQRYRCRGSRRRTFSDLTGTPAAHLKKLERWLEHAEIVKDGEILRVVAERVGVHLSTAFRWRHRLLNALRGRDREMVSGAVELRSEAFAESLKGMRRMPRPARRHGIPSWEVRRGPRRLVIVAADRTGHVVARLLRGPRASLAALVEALASRIRGCPDMWVQWIPRATGRAFARHLGGRLCRGPPETGNVEERGPNAGAAWAYGWRLRRWLVRFRGVATRYLPNYLVWHRCIEAIEGRPWGNSRQPWPLTLSPAGPHGPTFAE